MIRKMPPEENKFLVVFSDGEDLNSDFKSYVVHYKFFQPPSGTLRLQPARLNFDMLTLLDGSPVLNQVFFKTGKSDISDNYVLLKDRAYTAAFNESILANSTDRYKNVLNIIGRRLCDNPNAQIKIVGCNSHRDQEYNRRDLSRSRTESVKAYLKYIWGIDAARMQLEVRNRPAVASTSSVAEGRVENQRALYQARRARCQKRRL